LVGPPGVGKGTQATLLSQRLGLLHLASGDLFRAEIAARTELGMKAREYIDRGDLVPDAVTISMMESRLSTERAKTSGFVLDGFPRTVAQAEALQTMLASHGLSISRVVSLEVDDQVVVDRLSGRRICPNCGAIYHVATKPPKQDGVCDVCGATLSVRPDDKPETIRQRLNVFHSQSQPVLDFYRASGKLHSVDCDRPAEEVYNRVIEGLVV
jgi:adenylate kinase